MKWLIFAAALGVAGCGTLQYYAQLAQGQYQLLAQRQSIAAVIADPARDAALRTRLLKIQDARRYAAQTLQLPDNASYTEYTDLQRPFAVWNVFAAAEFSVEPLEHCFLIVGCLAYRGYFSEAAANAEAARLGADHYDTQVVGVPAYSTLGWFDDPVLSSMLNWNDEWLIGTLFHELAHQQLYVRDDTAFNESFASFVEEEGLRQYLAVRGGSDAAHRQLKDRQQQFIELILATREQLAALYGSGAAPEDLRQAKQAIFDQLRRNYAELRNGAWSGWTGYDRWFEGEINNAKLIPFALYEGWVPAFAALFRSSGSQWPAFYTAAAELGALDADHRERRLQELKAPAPRN